MNKKELIALLDKMDDREAVEIRKIGNSFEISKSIHPVIEKNLMSQQVFRTTSIVSITTNQFEHYREFGKKPVKDNEIEKEFVIGLFEQLVSMNPRIEVKSVKVNFIPYDVKIIDGMKGFYNKEGKLRWVEIDGIEYWNNKPEK